MKNYDDDVAIHPEQEPDVVALSNQNVQEVKDIIRNAEKAEEEWRKEKLQEALDDIQEACGKKGKEPKLLYDDESSDCCLPNLNGARQTFGFRKDVDEFALWRRLASVKAGSNIDPQVFCPTNDLMEYIIIKLNKSFPNLNLTWSEESWNPCLQINGCLTKISMEKIALAYQGLLNVADELNVQPIICNIIAKKLEELFI
jgi:hypothetical protein